MNLFRERSFILTTAGGLLIGVTIFGAIGYLPTYLQMVTGASATDAWLLMIPMMGALLLTSTVSGFLVSRTGRYKWVPIAGALAVTAALLLFLYMAPLGVIAALLFAFVHEKELSRVSGGMLRCRPLWTSRQEWTARRSPNRQPVGGYSGPGGSIPSYLPSRAEPGVVVRGVMPNSIP